MLAERELVSLLHRADWTRRSLSGEVTGIDEPQTARTLTELEAVGYSAPMAVSMFIRAARRAGAIAASSPASTAAAM
jgi:hypothetical protein